MKVTRMRDSKEFKAAAQKARMQGQEFTYEMWSELKRKAKRERTIREDQDPDIQAAFRKLNIDRLFKEFTDRPTRTSVTDMAEDFMQMDHEKRMSKRDKARKKFIANFKRQQAIKKNLKNTLIAERERLLDIEE